MPDFSTFKWLGFSGQGQLADFVPSLWYGREGAGQKYDFNFPQMQTSPKYEPYK